jgi:hypothetical protein
LNVDIEDRLRAGSKVCESDTLVSKVAALKFLPAYQLLQWFALTAIVGLAHPPMKPPMIGAGDSQPACAAVRR